MVLLTNGQLLTLIVQQIISAHEVRLPFMMNCAARTSLRRACCFPTDLKQDFVLPFLDPYIPSLVFLGLVQQI